MTLLLSGIYTLPIVVDPNIWNIKQANHEKPHQNISQHLSLINHKCRLLFIATDVSLETDAVAAVNWSTHTHTHSLSLCLSAILLFSPFFPFDIKTLATILSLSIEIQISTYSLVLISKVSSIRNYLTSILNFCSTLNNTVCS